MIGEHIMVAVPIIDPQTGLDKQPSRKKEIEGIRITIPEEMILRCKNIDDAKSFAYWNKPESIYKKGAYKGNTLVGMMGECALGILFNMTADLKYRPLGDGGTDFAIDGKKVDVKTARSPRLGRNFVVRVEKEHDKGLKSDIYIGSYLEDETILERDECRVILLGYTTKDSLMAQPLQRSYVLKCWNTEIYFSELLPLRDLANFS